VWCGAVDYVEKARYLKLVCMYVSVCEELSRYRIEKA